MDEGGGRDVQDGSQRGKATAQVGVFTVQEVPLIEELNRLTVVGANHETGTHDLWCRRWVSALGKAKCRPVRRKKTGRREDLFQIGLLTQHCPQGQSVGSAQLKRSVRIEEFSSGSDHIFVRENLGQRINRSGISVGITVQKENEIPGG